MDGNRSYRMGCRSFPFFRFVAGRFLRRCFVVPFVFLDFGFVFFCFFPKDIEIEELIAGRDEGPGCLAFAHAQDVFLRFPQARGQAREVTVGRNDAEAVEIALVQ